MKRRRLWLVVLSLIFSLCVSFCITACNGCNSCNNEGDTTVPEVLAVPEVTVDGNGLASWAEVANASGYAYKIDGGDEQTAEGLSVQLNDGQSVAVKAKGDGIGYADSEYCAEVRYTAQKPVTPVALTAPTVSISDGTASWARVENADKYLYQIREKGASEWGEDKTTTSTSVANLTEGQSIRVKAQSDSESYTDSEWSDTVTVPSGGTETPEPSLLPAPTVSISDGTASWARVENADKYLYQIREKGASEWGEDKITTSTSVANLTEGQSIRVKAQSDSESYTDSGWSNTATVPSGGTETPEPETPGIPDIFIDDNGSVHWTDVAGADWYEVEIDGVYAGITALNYIDKRLTDRQTVRVRAVKGGADADSDVFGEWSELHTYDEPELDIPNGIKFEFNGGKYSSNAYSASELFKVFESAGKNTAGFDNVTYVSNVYQGVNASEPDPLKFGSSSNNGAVTLTFKKEVVMVVINCKPYGSDACKLTVNGSGAQSPLGDRCDYTFTLETPSETVTVRSEKRCIIYGVTIYFEIPETLKRPVVEINPYGVATWDAVPNASGYTYSVNGTDMGAAPERRVELADNDTVVVTAVGDGINYLSSVSEEKTYTVQHYTLTKPEVVVSRGIAYWNIDKNAKGYVYRIDGGTEMPAPEDGKVPLESGQTIEVKALGDDIFGESDWSDAKNYTRPDTPVQLGAPVVTVKRDGSVSWTHNPENYKNDATGYKVAVDGVEKEGNVQLNDGEIVSVTALGDNIHFSDSPATELTYKAPSNRFDAPQNLTVEIEGTDRGAVILKWDAVEGASAYAYAVNEDYENAVTVNDTFVKVDLLQIDATALGNTWSFRVMTLGDGNVEIAPDGDYSGRFDASGYCDMTEFRVERGGDDTVYTVSQIVKVINYFGNKNLPEDTFKVSGTVFANTAYGTDINITLKEGVDEIVLSGAVMSADFAMAEENLFAGFAVTAEGKLSVNRTDGERRLIDGTAEVVFDSLDDRYALAFRTLNGLEALQDGAELTEEVNGSLVIPVKLYGVSVEWTVVANDEKTLVIASDGKVTVYQPEAGAGNAEVFIEAKLSYGGDVCETRAEFSVVVPRIIKKILDAPKISIDAKTGVATWTKVEGATGYYYTYYGFVDDDYKTDYVNEDGVVEADGERVVQLQNKLWITVQALGDGRYSDDGEIAVKQYNYYPETVEPDGTPLLFDFKDIPQNDKAEIKNPAQFFQSACDSSTDFKSVTTSNVYLGNSTVTASHIGGGFLKSGTAGTNGTITLTFNKKVNGVIIECQTWTEDTHDKVSVNGSEEQIAKKNGWGTLLFNFGTSKASETVKIVTNKRIFIKSITVYLGN